MQEELRKSGPARRTVTQMFVVGLIASLLGIALGLSIEWFPPADSTQAGPIDTLWDVLIIASVPVFVLVTIVILFSVGLFRMRPGEEGLDGPPVHGNTRLEVIWTAIPAILLVSLCTYAYVVLRDIEEAPASADRERVVTVTGQQFAWTFEYEEGGKKFASAQLFLPVDESVKFEVKSKDVIHDFWVPDFRMKIDAVPGITTSYRITPKGPGAIGKHEIVCAELCGLGHAYMRQTANVLPKAEFAAWVARMTRQQAGGDGGGEQAGPAPDGKQLFTQGNADSGAVACGSCHTLADAGTTGATGPNLDEVLKGKDAAFIRESIANPEAAIASGFSGGIMPSNYGQTLSPQQLDALVEYLSQVTTK